MLKTTTIGLALAEFANQRFDEYVAEQAGNGDDTANSPLSNMQKIDNFAKQTNASKVANAALYEEFSATGTYAVGAIVTYNGNIWKCHTAVSTVGNWTGTTNWTQTTVANLLLGVSGIATLSLSTWASNSYSLAVNELGANDAIFFSPVSATDKTNLETANIIINTNGATITFTAETTPIANISLNYFIVRGKA